MSIYLLRHGRCTPDGLKPDGVHRYVGQIDYPLCEEGRDEAARWRAFFARKRSLRVVCSDLLRTVQTTREVLGTSGRPFDREPALRELALGEWEGVPRKEIRQRFPAAYEERGRDLAGFRPPGGESFSDLQQRVVPVFERLCREQRQTSATTDLLIVTHAGVIRTLICHSTGMPLERMFSLGVDYAGLTCLDLTPRECVLRGMNLLPPGKEDQDARG